jgi:hypothetical protein
MLYRVPGSLSPPPPAPSPVSKLSLWSSLLTGEGWRGCGVGAKSYDGEKAWSSVNHSILSVLYCGKRLPGRWFQLANEKGLQLDCAQARDVGAR